MVRITNTLIIPDEELQFTAARSGGPGGQHVNTTSTKVVLTFDVTNSPSLSIFQRNRLLSQLEHKLTKDGRLVIQSSETKSQKTNKERAVVRFINTLRTALIPPKPRTPTKVPYRERAKRIKSKKNRAQTKQQRQKPTPHD